MALPKSRLHKRAVELRMKGCSYSEIIQETGVARGTLSAWLGSLELPASARTVIEARRREQLLLAQARGSASRIEASRAKEVQGRAKGAAEIGPLSARDQLMLFVGLYWGEGSKRNRWEASIVNGDPSMIRACLAFMRQQMAIPDTDIHAQVQVHTVEQVDVALDFWKEVCRLPPEQFSIIVTTSKRSKGIKPHRLPYGTVSLSVFDVTTLARVKGWIEGVASFFSPIDSLS